MRAPIIASLAFFILLAGCASPQERQRDIRARQAAEFLERVDPIADPGKVAATDIAMARAARDNGQWTALVEYASEGARLDAPGGFVTAEMMAQLTDPQNAMGWAPNVVWSSCDGSLAVSFGRFEEDGKIGSYVTAWQFERVGTYRWQYSAGSLDDPQPVRREDLDTPEGEDVIRVEALDMIEGKSADCARGGATTPAKPLEVIANSTTYHTTQSRDGTLAYRWEHAANGQRRVVVDYIRDGNWQRVLELVIAAGDVG